MYRFAIAGVVIIIFLSQTPQTEAHFFGETKRVDEYQIVFAPYPTNPVAGSNSTYLNFSVLYNGTNIVNVYAALVVADKQSGAPVGQIPYKLYEFSDISFPYIFSEPGTYTVTLQTRITGDDKYQATPLEASFDLQVDSPYALSIPFDELILFYMTPAAAAIAGIAIYLHSKKKL